MESRTAASTWLLPAVVEEYLGLSAAAGPRTWRGARWRRGWTGFDLSERVDLSEENEEW